MQLNKIIDDYVVSEQITVDDIQTIKEAGFKTIFCNRPDNEEINQVTVESIKNAALKNGPQIYSSTRHWWANNSSRCRSIW
jgi:sulfide:quinone oxidoreductase